MITTSGFSLGFIASSLVALHFQDSRRNQIVSMVLFQLPLLAVGYFKIPESGLSLLQNGEYQCLEQELMKIAKRNGRKVTFLKIRAFIQPCSSNTKDRGVEFSEADKLLHRSDDKSQSETNTSGATFNFFDRFKTFRSSFLCITNVLAWMATAQIYFGLTFGVNIFRGNVYLNSVLLSMVEFPGVLSIILVNKFGRKPILCLIFII